MADQDRTGLMEGFLATIGVKKDKKRGKHATIVREGEAIVEDVDPRYAHLGTKNAIEVPTGATGFARGPIASGKIENPQR